MKTGRRRKRTAKKRLIRSIVILLVICAAFPVLYWLEIHGKIPAFLEGPVRTVLSVFDDSFESPLRPGKVSADAGLEELPASLKGYLVVDCIDVGQGDATLIRQGDHAMLFDCGGEIPMAIRRYLRNQGILKLDYVWLSHGDADHIGAFSSTADAVSVEKVMLSPFMDKRETYAAQATMDTISWQQIPVTEPVPGDTFSLGDALIHVLGPIKRDEEEDNNNSLAVRVVYGDTSVLLCGDAQREEEEDLLASGQELKSDVLHVSHHGSNSSSTKEFLARVSPSYAVISCGVGNDYGHPGQYALARLKECGAAVLRTDLEGDVRLISDGGIFRASVAGKASEETG